MPDSLIEQGALPDTLTRVMRAGVLSRPSVTLDRYRRTHRAFYRSESKE